MGLTVSCLLMLPVEDSKHTCKLCGFKSQCRCVYVCGNQISFEWLYLYFDTIKGVHPAGLSEVKGEICRQTNVKCLLLCLASKFGIQKDFTLFVSIHIYCLRNSSPNSDCRFDLQLL